MASICLTYSPRSLANPAQYMNINIPIIGMNNVIKYIRDRYNLLSILLAAITTNTSVIVVIPIIPTDVGMSASMAGMSVLSIA